MRFQLTALGAALLLGSACASPAPASHVLNIAAASHLRAVLDEVVPRFEAQHPNTAVQVIFGSTGQLAQQIANGAPYDALVAADTLTLQQLEAQGLIRPGAIWRYGRGTLALVVNSKAAAIRRLEDLRTPAARRIAIANPNHAPYGFIARQALQRSGLWDAVQDRLVLAESAQQALQFVQLGDAQAGLVAYSLVAQGSALRVLDVPTTYYDPLDHAIGITARADQPALAQQFVDFLLGPEGQAILRRYGL